jgi:hypothetical protein
MADNPDFIEIQKHLSGVDYPCSRDQLVETAQSEGAPDDLLERLRSLPDQQYDAPTAVTKALAG